MPLIGPLYALQTRKGPYFGTRYHLKGPISFCFGARPPSLQPLQPAIPDARPRRRARSACNFLSCFNPVHIYIYVYIYLSIYLYVYVYICIYEFLGSHTWRNWLASMQPEARCVAPPPRSGDGGRGSFPEHSHSYRVLGFIGL